MQSATAPRLHPPATFGAGSWFGLVNQVANYAQLRDLMAPLKRFLSPKEKLQWTPTLDQAFIDSNTAILEAVQHGVEIFDPAKPTCLRPDWSTKGIGYFLLQKHCHCCTDLPDCCADGWRITLSPWQAHDSYPPASRVTLPLKERRLLWLGDLKRRNTSRKVVTICWLSLTTNPW